MPNFCPNDYYLYEKNKKWLYLHAKWALKHFYFKYFGKYEPLEAEFDRSAILVNSSTLTFPCVT
jgi:hypothetical protein